MRILCKLHKSRNNWDASNLDKSGTNTALIRH